MTQKNTKKDNDWENVKMRRKLVNRLRENKEKTFVPIIKFVEVAVLEKLEKQKSK